MEDIENDCDMDEIVRAHFEKSDFDFVYDLGYVVNMVFDFSNKGPEFMEAVYDYCDWEMTPEFRKTVKVKRKENAKIVKKNRSRARREKIHNFFIK